MWTFGSPFRFFADLAPSPRFVALDTANHAFTYVPLPCNTTSLGKVLCKFYISVWRRQFRGSDRPRRKEAFRARGSSLQRVNILTRETLCIPGGNALWSLKTCDESACGCTRI